MGAPQFLYDRNYFFIGFAKKKFVPPLRDAGEHGAAIGVKIGMELPAHTATDAMAKIIEIIRVRICWKSI